ncbi:energy-coupling factor ABC transporter ATP-binding protein [Microaceticoccus formicicus]|uniref:energy-coupling factor ABC transporter ATP-binding protein n=1 Tax=Microaceticoccus formicicus TaxID=3118105 RepID=UPI003CD00F06|nr:energy-coupling factor ABC transporter ATP-binding protein [Peptoniphilaceae bacterium AMB_02]
MLKVENLKYIYPDGTLALDDISMDFDKGSCIGIIGENGAGKSTLLLNILGILKPSSGTVKYLGNDIEYNSKYMRLYRSEVNLMMQDPDRQIFYSTVKEDVGFALRNLGHSEEEIEEKVERALTITGLKDIQEKSVNFLSYGQKKRVALAGLLVMNLKLLFMDEPTAGLDPKMVEGMKKLLYKLMESGIKLVISSHDMNFIYEMCDYIYLLKSGKQVKEGNEKEVFLDTDFIKSISLEQPSLVKLHLNTSLPLFKHECELYEYLKK